MDKPTGSTVSPQEALIYAMVTLSAVDKQMTDRELRKIGGRLLYVRRLFGRRKVLGIRRAVLSQRATQRRALLLEVVLGLLAVEFDEHIAGTHSISKVVMDPVDNAIGLRRDRDVVDGRESSDDFERTRHGLFAHGLDLHGLGRIVAPASLRALGLGTGRGGQRT